MNEMRPKIIIRYQDFFKKITMVSISFMVSSFILFLFHIYLGRNLGPEGYGNFAYTITVGNFLALLYRIGLQPAIINIISPKSGDARIECVTTTLILLAAHLIVVSTIYLSIQGIIGILFNIDASLVKYSILFAATFALFNLTQAFVQSLQDMKAVSIMRLLSSLLYVLIFFVVQFFGHDLLDFRDVVQCKTAGLGIAFSFALLFVLRKELKFSMFNPGSVRVLYHYAIYGFLLQLSATFTIEFSKVILKKYFEPATIGLFQVYIVSSASIAEMFVAAIVIVYFPTISKSNNKAEVIKTLSSYEKYLPFLFLPMFLVSYLFFRLYGDQYQVNLLTLSIFNAYVIFFFATSIYSRTLESFGVSGVRSSFKVSFSGAVLTVILSFLSIPILGINGAIVTMALTRVFFFMAFKYYLKGRIRKLEQGI